MLQGASCGLSEIVSVHIEDQTDFLRQGGCGEDLLNMSRECSRVVRSYKKLETKKAVGLWSGGGIWNS